MVDKIVTLDDNNKYVILDEKQLDQNKYYFGLKLDAKEEPTNVYLFFEEIVDNGELFLNPVVEDNVKGILLTVFTANYLNMAYDTIE